MLYKLQVIDPGRSAGDWPGSTREPLDRDVVSARIQAVDLLRLDPVEPPVSPDPRARNRCERVREEIRVIRYGGE